MKERIMILRLMQEGWIPVLTGLLSASAIFSLVHSAGMAYITALLLMTLYFIAITFNRFNIKAMVAIATKRILQQTIRKIRVVLRIKELGDLCGNILSLWVMRMDLAKHYIEQLIAALIGRFAGLVERLESIRATFMGLTNAFGGDGMFDLLKNGKSALGKLIQSFRA